MQIAIIDDSEVVLEFMKIRLLDMGYSFIAFQNPLEAIKEIPSIQPRIIISDWLMFSITGDELIKNLKQLGVNAKYILFTSIDGNDIQHICDTNNILLYNKSKDIEKLLEDIQCLL